MPLIHHNDKLHFLRWLVRRNPAVVVPKVCNYARYLRGSRSPRLPYNPVGLGAAVTERCNQKCPECYWLAQARDKGSLKPTDLDPADFGKILRRFGRDAVHCSFTGGEPLLHRDILTLIGMAAAVPMYTSLFTNGILLDRFAGPLLDSGMAVLNVSPHILEERPEIARDPDSVHREKALSNIAQFCARASGRGIRTSINVMVDQRTFPYMHDIIRAGERMGVDVVRMMSPLSFGETSSFATASWDEENVASYLRDKLLPLRPSVDVVLPKFHEKGKSTRICQELFRYLKFTVDGEVYPCCYLPLNRGYGNVFTDAFDWNGEALREARAKILDHNRLTAACSRCAHTSIRNIQYNRIAGRWTGDRTFG